MQVREEMPQARIVHSWLVRHDGPPHFGIGPLHVANQLAEKIDSVSLHGEP
jgi:hypothetical protein